MKATQIKQISSTSKVSEQTTRSKKFISGKSGTLQNKLIQRLKSNDQAEMQNKVSKTMKPRSSLSRRPMSSHKPAQNSNTNTNSNMNMNANLHTNVSTPSLNANMNAKSEQQIKQIIGTIFSHSKKLQNFISQKNLDQNQTFDRLVNNDLFILSLVSMVSNSNPQQINKCVQRSCIHKIDRMIAMQKQKKICENLENKIGLLIDQRIKALSHF